MSEERERVIDISKGRYWEANGLLYGIYGSPRAWGGGLDRIERHYPGIILRDRREMFEDEFSIHELVIGTGADLEIVNKLERSIMQN